MQNAAAQTPSAIAAKEKKSATAREQLAKRNALDIGKDGLMQAIAKLGGINAEAARKEFGIDPADMKLHGVGILRSFTKAGKQLDTMRELLLEQGYPVGESVRDFGDAIGEAMSGNDIMTPEGMEALAQKNFEEYSAREDELSEAEQAQLDKLVTWATNKFGADVMAETDAALASAMKGESPAQIERALIRILQEEYDNDQSNEGTQQAAEGQARLDNQSGSEEGGGKRNVGISEESNGREEGSGIARDGQEQTVNQNVDDNKTENVSDKKPFELTKKEYEKTEILENKSVYVKVGNSKVEVIRNPTHSQMQEIKNDAISKYGKAENGDPVLRSTQDSNGNKYYWKAGDAIHVHIEPSISKEFSIEVNQNAFDGKLSHRSVVRNALYDGEIIPENILAGYPDLIKEVSDIRDNKLNSKYKNNDLLGDNTAAKQAIADAERAKDAKRNSGESNTDGFTLTGSNSEADKAAAMGAQDLFAQPIKTKPESAAKEEQQPDESALKDTSDVGVEMLGNRRSKGLTMKDILNADNETARVALAVKAKLWDKPDYQALVDSGVQPVIAHLVKQLYDSLSTTPAYQGEKYLYAYVNTVELAKKAVDDFLADKNAMVKMILAVATKAKRQSYMMSGAGNGVGVAISELSGKEAGEEDAAIFDYFLDRIFPKNAQGYRWGKQNTEGNEKANATGKRFYREVQVNLSNFIDAMKAVQEGFPAKQEAWQRSYVIKEKDGKFQVVKKNRYSPTSEHETREQAVNAARELTKRNRKEEFVEPDTPIEKSKRIGREIRKGNISSEELKTTIGLKAVNFGNWMQQASNAKERQQHVNSAYDAFFDLSEVLNLPIKAMSLNGMLGLAIGAQGKGKHAAHFYAGFNDINLTREKGAGSLAHEWAHGLDHYFGVQTGLASFDEPFASWRDNYARRINPDDVTVRPEIDEAFRTIVKTMKRKQESIEDAKKRVESDAKAARERFDRYMSGTKGSEIAALAKSDKEANAALQSIIDGKESDYVVWPAPKGKRKPEGYTYEKVKLIADKLGWNYSTANDFNGVAISLISSQKTLEREPQQRELHTNFYRSASILDAGKKDAYWSTNHELFARAFEMYVADKLADKDGVNNYLVSAWKLNTDDTESTGNEILDMIRDQARQRYPMDEDRKTINAAFDVLFNEIRTKETDEGVMLFSRSAKNTLSEQLQLVIDGNNPAKGNVLIISDNSPASLQMFGFKNLPVVTRTGADGVLKMHYNHGLTATKLANVIERGLKRPAMILQYKGQDDVESLRFVTDEIHNGNPVILAIQPEKQSATGNVQLIATAFEVSAETIVRDIKNGNLLYRDTTAKVADNIRSAITNAQIKYAREPRSLLGVIPNSAPSRRQAYKVLSQSDIVKFEKDNDGLYFNRNDEPATVGNNATSRGTGAIHVFVPAADQSSAQLLNRGMVKYFHGNEEWSNAYVQSELSNALSGNRKAIEYGIGTRVAATERTRE